MKLRNSKEKRSIDQLIDNAMGVVCERREGDPRNHSNQRRGSLGKVATVKNTKHFGERHATLVKEGEDERTRVDAVNL